jgi:hypothetical protein
MKFHYTAKFYIDKQEIAHESGDDLDQLYDWMIIKAQGQFGDLHGEVIDNKTGKVVKAFRKSPPD